jgi:predicted GNAT superfamily acetyltransferase
MDILTIEHNEFDSVLALNAASVPNVNLISREELQWLFARVAKIDDRLAGFLIGLRPGTAYQSPNYRWFCDNYENFAYIDRIAVSEWARRKGVAQTLYDLFARSQPDAPVLTCEVNLRPPNVGSMLFHEQFGFRQVGTQETNNGEKEVALMEKSL